jgi:xanthine dehydrogenase accessory factor
MSGKNSFVILPGLIKTHVSCVVATVTESHGSTPQKPGSTAIFGSSGLLAGTVGGGTVEHAIQQISETALKNKISSIHSFSLNHEVSDAEGSICGGGMKVLVDAQPERHQKVFDSLVQSLNARQHGVLVTVAREADSEDMLIQRFWVVKGNEELPAGLLNHDIRSFINEMLNNPLPNEFRVIDSAFTNEKESVQVFLQTVAPLPRLVIAGAGHVGKALSSLGKFLDFEVTVWDNRKDYATRENLPDADFIMNGSAENSFGTFKADKNTYIVLVTTGHKQDMEVLKKLISSDAGYIGMIGSRKKAILVRDVFLKEGWATKEQWDKLYTPVGIDIHSETVEEIAISIAAELVMVRHQLNNRNE